MTRINTFKYKFNLIKLCWKVIGSNLWIKFEKNKEHAPLNWNFKSRGRDGSQVPKFYWRIIRNKDEV